MCTHPAVVRLSPKPTTTYAIRIALSQLRGSRAGLNMGLKRATNFTSLLQLFSLVVVIATGRLRQIHGPRNVLERSGFRSFMLFVSVRMLIRTGDLTHCALVSRACVSGLLSFYRLPVQVCT